MRNRQVPKDGRRFQSSVAGAIAFLLAGPILWAVHFFLVYGLQSTLCTFARNSSGREFSSLVSGSAITVTIIALLLQIALLLCPLRIAKLLRFQPTEKRDLVFAISVSCFLTTLSMLGVAWAGIGAVLLDPCGRLR